MDSPNVDVRFLNAFLLATQSVLETVLDQQPTKGQISVRNTRLSQTQLTMIVPISGDVAGFVMLGMSLPLADQIASKMIGHTIVTFDEKALCAITELANMICGNAVQEISRLGYESRLEPPRAVRGIQVEVSTSPIQTIVVPIELEIGVVHLLLGLHKAIEGPSAAELSEARAPETVNEDPPDLEQAGHNAEAA
jgi:chemotaxis protein CheX